VKPVKQGQVVLVGAGPGDPGLLTLKGRDAIRGADAIVYDSLISESLLSLAPAAKKVYVGKNAGHLWSPNQKKINQELVRLARQGKNVVRLKGGDPLIFGRGGEEIIELATQGIPFEIIPGVTAASGAAASAAFSLTHRDVASQVTFLTAHEDPARPRTRIRWKALAQQGGTLVVYMGVKTLPKVVSRLMRAGLSKTTPCLVVQSATQLGERAVAGTLKNIAALVKEADIQTPSVVIIGQVVGLRRKVLLERQGSLRGKQILVTRARTQSKRLRSALENHGASVIEMPTIEIRPPKTWKEVDLEIKRLKQYKWIVFTSANGVERFIERVLEKADIRVFGNARICAIGSATARKLEEYHLKADHVPKEYVSEALAKSFARMNLKHQRILLARADIARPFLRERLLEMGAKVKELVVYRTEKVKPANSTDVARMIANNKIDCVTFTSASTVKSFMAAMGKSKLKTIKDKAGWISIGPITSMALQEGGMPVTAQAQTYDINGLVAAVVTCLQGGNK